MKKQQSIHQLNWLKHRNAVWEALNRTAPPIEVKASDMIEKELKEPVRAYVEYEPGQDY